MSTSLFGLRTQNGNRVVLPGSLNTAAANLFLALFFAPPQTCYLKAAPRPRPTPLPRRGRRWLETTL